MKPMPVLALCATVVIAAACSGSTGRAAAPAPADTARLSPRILTEPAPRESGSGPIVIDASARVPSPAGRRASADFSRLAITLLDDPMFRSMHWGILVVDPRRGDTLYARNADKLFVPASNTKLVTAAVALAQLGGEYRYRTRVFARAPRQGVINGDLVVVGEGDPSFSDSLSGSAMAPLLELADSLRARGVRRITGRLASGANTFPGDTIGLGWAWDDLEEGYAGAVDELTFNEGFARVTVLGGARPGAPVTVRREPAASLPRLGRVDISTVSCCALRREVRTRVDLRGPRPVLHLEGSVRVRDSLTLHVALQNPNTAFLDAFEAALRTRGITVAGGVAIDTVVDTVGLTLLASRTSPPLAAILPAFQKPSQNQIGELLLRTLGHAKTGVGTADSGRAVVKRQLEAWGIDSSQATIRDGSGLSRRNFVSPQAIVHILDHMRTSPEFDAWYQSLPVAGVDGTLRDRMRGTLAAGNVRAKTGTLDRVRALSGYVTTADGQVLLFSMLANNHPVPTREVERVQDALLAALASLQLLEP
ncbi:MAG: D-alanyl-D-alanine carboxypeptidase/D-alanyl-D-alanine-endopeptidase [Gemmatimonas sp.]|nr:D-alanyl-D-alanine carboxypeptidase/D-alanyl-D-alanine-endopeptidase [Gemmatimonas sp.]